MIYNHLMLHDDFLFEQSAALAERVLEKGTAEKAAESSEMQIETAWQITTGRSPDAEELQLCLGLVERHEKRFSQNGDSTTARQKALARLCHMLLNSNEFLYVP